MSDQVTARPITIPQEIDAARRAVRGVAAYAALGYQAQAAASLAEQTTKVPFQHAVVNVSTATTTAIIAGVSGQAIEVMEIMLYTDTSMDLELFDGTKSLTGLLKSWPAAQGFFFPYTGEPHFSLTPGAALNLVTSAAGQVSGFIRYRQV